MTLRAGVFLFEIGVGYEIGVAAHVARDTLIEVTGFRATAAVPREESDSAGVLLQQFLGEKLYLKGGPRIRHLLTHEDLGRDDLEKRKNQVDVGVDLAFGMRTQHEGFVFGVDFLSVYVPVSSVRTREEIVDRQNQEVLDSTRAALLSRVDVRVPAIYVGACF